MWDCFMFFTFVKIGICLEEAVPNAGADLYIFI